jgi:hypothetical protein
VSLTRCTHCTPSVCTQISVKLVPCLLNKWRAREVGERNENSTYTANPISGLKTRLVVGTIGLEPESLNIL